MERVCRVCRRGGGGGGGGARLRGIFARGPALRDGLVQIARVRVEPGDALPQLVCAACVRDLLAALSFKRRCEESDAELRRALTAGSTPNPPRPSLDDAVKLESEVKEEEEEEEEDYASENATFQSFANEDWKENFNEEPLDKRDIVIEESINTENEQNVEDVRVLGITGRINEKKITEAENNLPERETSNSIIPNDSAKIDLGMLTKQASEENKLIIVCETCSRTFSNVNSCKRHMQVHKRPKNPEKGLFICDHCGKQFGYLTSMKRHIMSHNGEFPFECLQCPYKATHSNSLRLHMFTHTKERPYACPHCSKTFTTQAGCAVHAARHENRYPHLCDECPKAFTDRRHLNHHKLSIHLKQFKYKCEMCHKKLVTPEARNLHLERVHNVQIPSKRYGYLKKPYQKVQRVKSKERENV